MFLLIGLGNPGQQYQNTRHNVGFMAVDVIASAASFPLFVKKDKVLLTEGRLDSHRLMIVKPQSFMNLSGPPVAALASFFKIPLDHCIVFHDDLDLPLGKIRLKKGGGDGGHNGLRSLDQHIGKDYHRVRIGIGRPSLKEMVSHYVLSDFTKDEHIHMSFILKNLSSFLPLLLSFDISLFMTRLNEAAATIDTMRK